jgi:hypothetical protein
LLEGLDRPAKKRALEEIVAKWPTFAPGWWQLVILLEKDDARFNAIERGLDASPDAETKGMLLINKALLLARRGDQEDALRILRELADDPDSTLGTGSSREDFAHTGGRSPRTLIARASPRPGETTAAH